MDGTLSLGAPGLLGNDTGDGLTVTAVRPVNPPPGYALSWNADGSVDLSFSPQPGTYAFEDDVSDQSGQTATAGVSVNVPPMQPTCPGYIEANDDVYSTPPGTPLEVAAPGLLANDLNDGYVEITSPTGPVHGELTLGVDGSFVYTPPANFIGEDRFAYAVRGGMPGNSCPDEAIVTITVA